MTDEPEYIEPFDRFADALDALIEHERNKPQDDQLSVAEIVAWASSARADQAANRLSRMPELWIGVPAAVF